MKEEDFIRLVFVAETHDELMFFTNTGRLFVKGAYEIPEAAKAGFGRPLVNLLNLQEGEQVLQLLPIRSFEGDVDVFFATRNGTVKKTLLGDYQNVNKSGIRAINIDEGDELVGVRLVKPSDDVIMLSRGGRAMRFAATDVRRMGRAATGVRGIRLLAGDRVVSFDVVDDEKTLFIATANGYGKRCEFRDFTRHGRGGQGMIGIKGADRNGEVVAAHAVADDEHVISITSDQQMVRSPVSQFRVQSRMAQGVRLVRLSDGASLVSVSVCESDDADEASAGGAGDADVNTTNENQGENP